MFVFNESTVTKKGDIKPPFFENKNKPWLT